jgi:hypothetical protein
MMRFTDATGRWQAVRSDMPLPVAGGQVLQWLSDDFATLNTDIWEVSGTPSVGSSELTVPSGAVLLSRQGFQPPCLIEVVATMTARASGDDFRIGFYTDDDNMVEWRAAGSTGSNMDAVMRAGGVLDEQNGINVGAANGQYQAGEHLCRCRRSGLDVPQHQLAGGAQRSVSHSGARHSKWAVPCSSGRIGWHEQSEGS